MMNFYNVHGAIYLDQGYDAAKLQIEKAILTTFAEILSSGSWLDPKSRLQEVAQSEIGFTPVYKVTEEVGPDHDKIFTIAVSVENKIYGSGKGPSKQAAQQAAAEMALRKLEVGH